MTAPLDDVNDPRGWTPEERERRIAAHVAWLGPQEVTVGVDDAKALVSNVIDRGYITLEPDGALRILDHDIFQDAYLHVLINDASSDED